MVPHLRWLPGMLPCCSPPRRSTSDRGRSHPERHRRHLSNKKPKKKFILHFKINTCQKSEKTHFHFKLKKNNKIIIICFQIKYLRRNILSKIRAKKQLSNNVISLYLHVYLGKLFSLSFKWNNGTWWTARIAIARKICSTQFYYCSTPFEQ